MAVERMDKQDLDRVRSVQAKYHNLIYKMGELALQEQEVERALNQVRKDKDKANRDIDEVQNEYQRLSQEMNKKYGDVVFDLDTGEAVKQTPAQAEPELSEQ